MYINDTNRNVATGPYRRRVHAEATECYTRILEFNVCVIQKPTNLPPPLIPKIQEVCNLMEYGYE